MPLSTNSTTSAPPDASAGQASRKQRIRHVKARLYPLTPFTKFLEFLVERLPRRLVDVRLEPGDDLAPLGKGEYRSTGRNPSFVIVPDKTIAAGGWFYLEAALVRHTGDREALVYGRGPEPASHKFECPIPSNLRGTVREVIFIPRHAQRVYWSPMREPGFFSQSELLLHRITGLEAWLRRAHRVFLTWQQQPPGQAPQRLRLGPALWHLQDAYLQTARMQIERYRGHDYAGFLALRDKLATRELAQVAARVERLGDAAPRLSVLMHVDAAVVQNWLAQALESLRAQGYRAWEAVVVVEPQVPPATREWLARQARELPGIRLLEAPRALGDTEWLAPALEAAHGELVGVLGSHDQLAANALLLFADAVVQRPGAAVVYADHDSVHPDGKRFDPCFKPDWNPDWLASQNYIAQPCFFQVETLRRVGGYRAEFAPAQAYDLLLRACFSVAPESIVHIPRILYHRRTLAQAQPVSQAEHAAGKRALQDALGKQGARIRDGLMPGSYHVRHAIPEPAPLVSIIVPTRDKLAVLKACVDSVRAKTTYAHWELLIVDNSSQEPATLAWLEAQEQDPRIRVLRDPRPFNYSALNNRAVREASGEVIVLLNNDIEVIEPEWLDELVSHALRPGIGAVGAKLLYPNGMVQHAGVVLGIGGVAGHVHRYLGGDDPGYMGRAMVTQNFCVVTAACLALRKTLYLEVGGLDEQDLRVAFNDVDLCFKLVRAGYRNVFTPFARLYHHESLSRGHDDTPEKQAVFKHEFSLMKQRLGGFIDPAYNPNLSLEFEDFSLRRS